MAAIDPTTNLGKVRLRVADFGDIPYLPDNVYTQTLADNDQNIAASARICATYILGTLAFKTHRKIGLSLEIWAGEAFTAYKEFLLLTVTNPNFADYSPLPLQSLAPDSRNKLVDFINDFNNNYYSGTQSQAMALSADVGPNDGSRYGPLGDISTSTTNYGNGWIAP